MKDSAIQITHLRAFVTVAQTGSLTAAAEILGYTEPAVHLQLAAFSRSSGGVLFTRVRRRMELTELGAALLPYATDALLAVDGLAHESARWHAQQEHVLRVGLGRSIGSYVFPHIAWVLRESHPEIVLETSIMAASEIPVAIAEDRVDIGFASGLRTYARDRGLTGSVTTAPLSRYRWALVASPALAERVGQGRAGCVPVYLPEYGGAMRESVEERLRGVGSFTVSVAGNSEAAKAAALADLAIAHLPEYACRLELASGALVRCFPGVMLPENVIYFGHRRSTSRPDVARFVACLRPLHGFLAGSPVVLTHPTVPAVDQPPADASHESTPFRPPRRRPEVPPVRQPSRRPAPAMSTPDARA